MKRFKLSVLGLASVLCLGFAATAFAYPHMGGDNNSDTRLSEEQITNYNRLSEKHRMAVEPIMQQLITKKAELQALLVSDKPDSGKIENLSKEIGGLKGKLMGEGIRFDNQLGKQGIPTGNYSGGGYDGYDGYKSYGHKGYGHKGYGHRGYRNNGYGHKGYGGHGGNCMW